MSKCDENNVNDMLSFIFEQPCEDEIVDMDCNDYCGRIARLAEMVADGKDLQQLRPAFEQHIQHWSDCREEFEALVSIIKAENNGKIDNPEIEKLLQEIENAEKKQQ